MGRLLRLALIVAVVLRHGLDELLLGGHGGAGRWLRFLSPGWWRRARLAPRGERIRRALEDLGPVFVKLGQLLSVRPDLIPVDVTTELSRLRDRVPPFPAADVLARLEAAYGSPASAVFESFDEAPLASASIAQVHLARLREGAEVAVKVVRPGIEETIARDIGLVRWLAAAAEACSATARRLRPREVVDEYERIIFDELDMLREAASAAQLATNFAGSDLLVVPAVHWGYTRERVLVLDRVTGIPIDDVAALRSAGVDLRQLAERGVEIFFTQVFRHNFFHADMHPGNIFVETPAGGDEPPRYVAVDFGIMGSLGAEDLRYLAENFVAFFKRDYRRVAELHVASRWVPPGTRVADFETAIRSVCEPIFQQPLKDISFAQLLVRLFRTARRFDMEVQPQLVLLQKTLLHIEGLGRQLYPELDLWQTAKPFLERWMSERISPRRAARELLRSREEWALLAAEFGPDLPAIVADALAALRRRRIALEPRRSGSGRGRGATPGGRSRLGAAALVAAGLLLAGSDAGRGGISPLLAGGFVGAGLAWLLAQRPRE